MSAEWPTNWAGTDGTGIAPPAGGEGIRGWLSGIYKAVTGVLSVNRLPDSIREDALTASAGAASEVIAEVVQGMTMLVAWFHGVYGSATVKIECSFDGGTTWMVLFGGNVGTGSGTSEPLSKQSNATVGWEGAIPAGVTHVRAHCTEYTSGTITVKLVQGSSDYETAIATQSTLNSSSNAVGLVGQIGVWFNESHTVLAAKATFSGAVRSVGATSGTNYGSNVIHAGTIVAFARSDKPGTLVLEAGWEAGAMGKTREVTMEKHGANTEFTAEIVIPAGTLSYRVVYVNGEELQTKFQVDLKLNTF